MTEYNTFDFLLTDCEFSDVYTEEYLGLHLGQAQEYILHTKSMRPFGRISHKLVGDFENLCTKYPGYKIGIGYSRSRKITGISAWKDGNPPMFSDND